MALATTSKHKPALIALLAALAGLQFTAARSAADLARAEDTSTQQILSQEAFLESAFGSTAPPAQLLWLSGDLRELSTAVLGHPPGVARLRYWRVAERSAWVLEEIGKERLITVGIVVDERHIQNLKILSYRETRGWEVRNDFFTRQFSGAQLDAQQNLNQNIDSISGATLSVNAVKRLARLALLLDQHLPAP